MKVFLALIFLLFGHSSMSAQKTMADMIKEIPKEILHYLDENQLNEIKQFVGLKDTVMVKNMLDGTLSIDSISHDFAKITLNNATCLQMRLLTKNDSTQILCMVKTINRPVKESRVRFYSADWKIMEKSFGLPDYADDNDKPLTSFLFKPTEMTDEKFKELSNLIEPFIVSADFSQQPEVITFQLSLSLMSKEEKEEINTIVKQNSFKWDGSTFKKC